jgi:hypothetical protein
MVAKKWTQTIDLGSDVYEQVEKVFRNLQGHLAFLQNPIPSHILSWDLVQ